MRLTPQELAERARWLVRLRWVACAGVYTAVYVASSSIGLVARPDPLYAVAAGIVLYNLAFELLLRWPRLAPWRARLDGGVVLLQIGLDLGALTLLLYLADLLRNPFIFYYAFHVTLASILLPARTAWALACSVSVLVSALLALQASGWIAGHPLAIGGTAPAPGAGHAGESALSAGLSVALTSTLLITVYLTTSVTRYVERVHRQIRQHRKMLGIGQLVAGFAHQVSNPLDGLQNGLRQLGQGVRGNAHLEETARLMGASLERIEKVARRLQEFARPRGLELQPCDASRAVEATLQLFGKAFADRGVTIVTSLAKVPPALGDPYSLEEILFNLFTNALDAMPVGGRLRIRTSAERRPDLGGDPCIQIEVQDTGIGIEPSDMDRIFEPFYTTKAQSGGTGLGLGLCRMLISEMGGRIEAESVPLRGSTFRILLPPASGEAGEDGDEDPGRR